MPYMGISKECDVGDGGHVSTYFNVQPNDSGGCHATFSSDDGLPFKVVVDDDGVTIYSRDDGWDDVEAFVAFFRGAADLIEEAAKERRAALAKESQGQ